MSITHDPKAVEQPATPPVKYLGGFAEFSKFISTDDALSIYRKFDPLASRRILYMQSELQCLVQELNDLDNADILVLETSHDGVAKKAVDKSARDWEAFAHHASKHNERQDQKQSVIAKASVLLKEYAETLLRRSQILALQKPSVSSLNAFTGWFHNRQPFRGLGWNIFEDEDDLVALKPDDGADPLTLFINRYFGYFFRNRKPQWLSSWGQFYQFPDAAAKRLSAVLSVLFAVFLLLGAILALYFLPSEKMGKRLAVISIFTFVFALSNTYLTSAKRCEIFASTEA